MPPPTTQSARFAIIESALADNGKKLDDLIKLVRAVNGQVRSNQLDVIRNTTQIENIIDDVGKLEKRADGFEKRSNFLDATTGLLAFIGGILAFFGLRQ